MGAITFNVSSAREVTVWSGKLDLVGSTYESSSLLHTFTYCLYIALSSSPSLGYIPFFLQLCLI
jgi:hypothetical protein